MTPSHDHGSLDLTPQLSSSREGGLQAPPVVRTGASEGQARLLAPNPVGVDPATKIIISDGPALLKALHDRPDWTVLFEHYSQERFFKLPEGQEVLGEDLPKTGLVIASLGEGRIDAITEEEMKPTGELIGQFEILNEVATEDERIELVTGLNYGHERSTNLEADQWALDDHFKNLDPSGLTAEPRRQPGLVPNTTKEWLESIEAIYLHDGVLDRTVEAKMAKDTLLLHKTIPVLEQVVGALERIDRWVGGLVDAPDRIGTPNPREVAAEALAGYHELLAGTVPDVTKPVSLSAFNVAQDVASDLVRSNGDLLEKNRDLRDELERLREELGVLRERHVLTTDSLHDRTVALNRATARIEQLEKAPEPLPEAPETDAKNLTMPAGQRSAWVTVDDVSIHIMRTEDYIAVNAYPLGHETEDPIEEMEVSTEEARVARQEDPEPAPPERPEVVREPFVVAAPGPFHHGFKAWQEISDPDLDNEDARDLLIDAINNGRTMLEPLSPHVYFAAMNDNRPGVVDVAIQGLLHDHQSPQSKNFYRYMLDSVYRDAARLMATHKEWEPVATRAAYEVMKIDKGRGPTAETPEEKRAVAAAKHAYMVGGGIKP